MDVFAGTQRDHGLVAEGQLCRYRPAVTHQGDGIGVAWQAVEVRPVEAGKAFELVQRAEFIKGLGIQLDGRVGGVSTGTAAGCFLGMACVWRRVGTQEELA